MNDSLPNDGLCDRANATPCKGFVPERCWRNRHAATHSVQPRKACGTRGRSAQCKRRLSIRPRYLHGADLLPRLVKGANNA